MTNPPALSPRRLTLIGLVSIALAALLVWEIAVPIRASLAQRFLARGDTYLKEQEFDAAAAEYRKALSYEPSDFHIKSRLDLAKKAPTDIAAAAGFYQENHIQPVLDKLAKAQKHYADSKQALQAGVDLYQAKDFSYAQYPIKRALQLDPGYPEAWHYLGLTYQELAKIDPSFKQKADEAFHQRDLLTPAYLAPAPKAAL